MDLSVPEKMRDGVKDAITSEVKNYKLTIRERGKKERNNQRKGCQYFRRV